MLLFIIQTYCKECLEQVYERVCENMLKIKLENKNKDRQTTVMLTTGGSLREWRRGGYVGNMKYMEVEVE